jgi:catechol 2,3-dioxygenase-like lactoylglutathione lyase family enzyme
VSPSSPKLDMIGLVVDDLEASASFYRRLGIEFPDPLDPEGHGHVEATLRGGIRVALDTAATVREFDPQWKPPSEGHRMGIAFLCDSPAGVDAVYKELIGDGVESYKEPWDAFWGQRYAQVKDPDGNVVDLFAPLAD